MDACRLCRQVHTCVRANAHTPTRTHTDTHRRTSTHTHTLGESRTGPSGGWSQKTKSPLTEDVSLADAGGAVPPLVPVRHSRPKMVFAGAPSLAGSLGPSRGSRQEGPEGCHVSRRGRTGPGWTPRDTRHPVSPQPPLCLRLSDKTLYHSSCTRRLLGLSDTCRSHLYVPWSVRQVRRSSRC